jgi:uncharacterized integral membrane protein
MKKKQFLGYSTKSWLIFILILCVIILLFRVFKTINMPDYSPSFFVSWISIMAGIGIIASIVELRKK